MTPVSPRLATALLPCLVLLLLFLSSLLPSSDAARTRPRPSHLHPAVLARPTSINITTEVTISLPPHNVTVTPEQLCIACHVTLQEFLRFIVASFNQEEYSGVLEASAIASLFCTGEPFSHWQLWYSAACQELIMERDRAPTDSAVTHNVTVQEFFAPLLGVHTVDYYVNHPPRDFLLYKRRMCQQVAHCPQHPDPVGELPTDKSSDCAFCDGAALLLAQMVSREADIDADGSIDFVLRASCTEAAFWFEKPAMVDGACIELMEDPDWIRSVKKMVRNEGRAMRDEGKSREQVHQALRDGICVKLTAACPPQVNRNGGRTAKDELR